MPETILIQVQSCTKEGFHQEELSDLQKFATLVQTAKPMLLAIALRRTQSVEDAEDAVQEALMKGWRTISSFRGEASLSTWLIRILFNEIYQAQRFKRRNLLMPQETLEILEMLAFQKGRLVMPVSPEQCAVRSSEVKLLRRAIMKLPAAFRDVLLLEIDEEKSCLEMTKELRISMPAVKSRRVRARAELKKRLEQTKRGIRLSRRG